jgi:hypothetical protein
VAERDLGGDLVIEFVTRKDPMVVTLLRNKDDHYADYNEDVFERELAARFRICQASTTRVRDADHVPRAGCALSFPAGREMSDERNRLAPLNVTLSPDEMFRCFTSCPVEVSLTSIDAPRRACRTIGLCDTNASATKPDSFDAE